MNRVAGDVGGHAAAVAVSRAASIIRPVSGTRFWSASATELADFLAEVSALESQLAAMKLAAIADAHGRDIAGRAGAPPTQAWLRHRLNLTPAEAKKQTRLAAALDRDREVTRRALSEGVISAAHAQVIARAIEDLPQEVECRSGLRRSWWSGRGTSTRRS